MFVKKLKENDSFNNDENVCVRIAAAVDSGKYIDCELERIDGGQIGSTYQESFKKTKKGIFLKGCKNFMTADEVY